MREILFRGKVKYNGNHYFSGEWVKGFYLENEQGESFILDTEEDQFGNARFKKVQVIPETVGQYIELNAIDNSSVFDGDLLRFPAESDWEKKNFISYEIFFHDNDCANRHIGWQMDRMHFHGALGGGSKLASVLPKYISKMEIIGTIHDKGGE